MGPCGTPTLASTFLQEHQHKVCVLNNSELRKSLFSRIRCTMTSESSDVVAGTRHEASATDLPKHVVKNKQCLTFFSFFFFFLWPWQEEARFPACTGPDDTHEQAVCRTLESLSHSHPQSTGEISLSNSLISLSHCSSVSEEVFSSACALSCQMKLVRVLRWMWGQWTATSPCF